VNVEALNNALKMLEELGAHGYHFNIDVPDILAVYYEYIEGLKCRTAWVLTRQGIEINVRICEDGKWWVSVDSVHKSVCNCGGD
jgi:hypothetical protein